MIPIIYKRNIQHYSGGGKGGCGSIFNKKIEGYSKNSVNSTLYNFDCLAVRDLYSFAFW